MKKFNIKLLASLTSILLLQGCMPDSLSKFQKDPPKKAAPPAPAPAPSPVVDASGKPISFTAPTKFYFS